MTFVIIHKPQIFAKIIGYRLEEILEVISTIREHPRKYYFSYVDRTIKNGKIKERPIDPTRYKLRDIQNKIQSKILSKIPLPNHIHGSVKGKSNITHAQEHRSRKIQFQTDLTKFFQFVTNKMVLKCFAITVFHPTFLKFLLN